MLDGERRLAAIMFTDMVGYTALSQRNESLSLALVEEQRRLIRPILSRHGGKEIKTMGDAFLVEFPNALDAARCAYDIQRATREFNVSLSPEKRIHLRVGLHLGDIVESQGDISGDAVNVASRIESLAEDGGVCVTRQVFDQVSNKLELPLVSLGQKNLKNVLTPVEVHKMVMPWEEEKQERILDIDRKRIAILPFANISPDIADEYFADGLTEELICTMSRIRGLKVIARTSVMGYKGGHQKIKEVARELGVGTVLEGSVRRAGNRIRITAQLIDCGTSEHLWVESYDRELTDIFAVQSDISKTVADALWVQLLSEERDAVERSPTTDPEALTLYLKGRHRWNDRTLQSMNASLDYFEQATKLDPGFALAFSGSADCYAVMAGFDWMAPDMAYPKAKAFAQKALEIDGSLAEAHASLGIVLKNYSWDFTSAEKELRRAIELRPSYALAYHWLAGLVESKGKFEEAISWERRALEIDPNSALIKTGLAHVLADSDRIDEAMKLLVRVVNSDPAFILARIVKSELHILLSQLEAGVEEAKKAVDIEKTSPTELNLAWAYAAAGMTHQAQQILDDVRARSEREHLCPVAIGTVELAMGRTDEGFKWLEKALVEKDDCLLDQIGEAWFKQFKADPRWKSIYDRIGILQCP